LVSAGLEKMVNALQQLQRVENSLEMSSNASHGKVSLSEGFFPKKRFHKNLVKNTTTTSLGSTKQPTVSAFNSL
jgi:hypothetical protein